MTMRPDEINIKFLNGLQPERSKFVTNVKLARDLHTTNYDQLYAYLSQHEAHAHEVRVMHEWYPNPLALVANYHHIPSYLNIHHSQYNPPPYPTPSVPQNAYHSPLISQQPQAEFPQLDSSLVVPSFLPSDDLIAYLNKAMAFMSIVMASHFPLTKNQLITSSNLRNQAIIQDSRGEGQWQGSALSLRGQGILHGLRKRCCLFRHKNLTDDLDTYDSDCDDISSVKAVFMANLSGYDSQVLSEESKEKENKYIDKESDLENKIKELDNIVYKVGQSAQTVHMLMKPQVFYDDTHKQALGYQNLFYLKKAQRIKPTLYDGIVISKKHEVIFVDDSEETLILEEESRSKMLAKQNDPISKEKKIHISLINYSELNKLSEDFRKRFVLQKQLYTEQAFWLPLSNPNSEQFVFSHTSVKIEVPKELPKVSLVNKSFQKLKNHLAIFDKVVKDRITPTTITEDGWGFEHTKKVFLEEVIPFINSLRSSFKDFDNGLYSELNEVKMVFNQMEACVEQYLVHTAVNSLEVIDECKSIRKSWCEEYNRNLTLEAGLSKMNELSKTCSRLQNHCISLELELQQNKESGQNNRSCNNLDVPAFNEFFVINNLKAQLQAKESTISKLRARIAILKGKNVSDNHEPVNNASVIAPRMFRLDLEPLSHRLKNNREAHEDYLEKTKDHTDTLRRLELLAYVSETCPGSKVETKKLVAVTPMNKTRKVRSQEPKESSSTTQKKVALQTKWTTDKPLLSSTRVIPSTSTSGSQSKNNTRKNRITPAASSINKNKTAEALPRKVLQIVLWYLDSGCFKHMTGQRSQLIKFVEKFLSTVRFCNDHIAKIMGYGDYQMGNVMISRVYYVEGLGHNLFFVGQFCDSDLEVAFRKHTCYIRDLEGVDLLKGSWGSNLYTLSLENMMLSSPICLLSKASKTKKPDLTYFHVFGALCYPTNDSEDLGKLKPKADIGIFIRYAPEKKAYWIYNRRT
ncbi:hypothetical protein Tco_1254448 [Tanacetum coccineum]